MDLSPNAQKYLAIKILGTPFLCVLNGKLVNGYLYEGKKYIDVPKE